MEKNVWNTTVGIGVIFVGFIFFGSFNTCSSSEDFSEIIEEINLIDDINILDYEINKFDNYNFFNLSLLYTGPINEKDDIYRISLRIKQIHKKINNGRIIIYTSSEGFKCYSINKFNDECEQFKDDMLSYSMKYTNHPKYGTLNNYKLMKENGVLKEYYGIEKDIN